jgi:hypothetical protein
MYQWPLEKIKSGEYQENLPVFLIGMFAVSMFPAYFLWTLLGILWVKVADDNTQVVFHYLFKTVKLIPTDIDGYYKTHNDTKLKRFHGFLIKLKSGKVVEVSEYNLRSIDTIGQFLRTNKVPLRGNKGSWFPLTRRV